MFETIFRNKKPNKEKLVDFGFLVEGSQYVFSTYILSGQFLLKVIVGEQDKISTCLIDSDTQEEYTLYLSESVVGAFVGKIRKEIENILQQVADACFETSIFQNLYTCNLIKYVQQKYGDDLEFLWKKLPKAAIWRRKDTKKWYATLLVIAKNKLGLNASGDVEILGLRVRPEEAEKLVDNQKYFAGYHMNKKHWITICLDASVPFDEICARLDESYVLAKKK